MLDPSLLGAALLRRWIWLVVPATALMLIGFLVSDAQPRRYEARAALVYRPTSGEQTVDPARTNDLVEPNIKTEERLLNGAAYQREFDARFGDDVVIEASALDGTDIIEIIVEASTPEVAAGVANAVVEDHIERRQGGLDGDLASARTSPTSPKPVRSGSIGALLGIVVGLGLALLREKNDRRLERTTEVRPGEPLLAATPASGRVPGLDVLSSRAATPEAAVLSSTSPPMLDALRARFDVIIVDGWSAPVLLSHPTGLEASQDEPGDGIDDTTSARGPFEGPRSALVPHPVGVESVLPVRLIESAQPAIDRRSHHMWRSTGDAPPWRPTGTGEWWSTPTSVRDGGVSGLSGRKRRSWPEVVLLVVGLTALAVALIYRLAADPFDDATARATIEPGSQVGDADGAEAAAAFEGKSAAGREVSSASTRRSTSGTTESTTTGGSMPLRPSTTSVPSRTAVAESTSATGRSTTTTARSTSTTSKASTTATVESTTTTAQSTSNSEERAVSTAAPGPAGPDAADDAITGEAGKDLKVAVMENDGEGAASLDKDTLVIVSGPGHAESYRVHGDHIHYRSVDGFSGEDRLRYRICDENASCDEATVFVTIEP